MFDEDYIAEIKVKQLELDALNKEKREIAPYMDTLVVEIGMLEEHIVRLKKKLKEEREEE